jgi:hypothetical protein
MEPNLDEIELASEDNLVRQITVIFHSAKLGANEQRMKDGVRMINVAMINGESFWYPADIRVSVPYNLFELLSNINHDAISTID